MPHSPVDLGQAQLDASLTTHPFQHSHARDAGAFSPQPNLLLLLLLLNFPTELSVRSLIPSLFSQCSAYLLILTETCILS